MLWGGLYFPHKDIILRTGSLMSSLKSSIFFRKPLDLNMRISKKLWNKKMNSITNKAMYHSLIIIIIITITSLVIKSNIDVENFSLVDKDIRNEYKKKIKTEKRERMVIIIKK